MLQRAELLPQAVVLPTHRRLQDQADPETIPLLECERRRPVLESLDSPVDVCHLCNSYHNVPVMLLMPVLQVLLLARWVWQLRLKTFRLRRVLWQWCALYFRILR